MSWFDVAAGGGFALGGVALQQWFGIAAEKRRNEHEARLRVHHENHEAYLELVRAARRVQRALVDFESAADPDSVVHTLGTELDRLLKL